MLLYLAVGILPWPASGPTGTYTHVITLSYWCTVLSDDGFCGMDEKGMSPKEEWPKSIILSGWHIPVWPSNHSPVITRISS